MKQGLRVRDNDESIRVTEESTKSNAPAGSPTIAVSLLTGGRDRHYVFGLASALLFNGIALELIGSDELDFLELRDNPRFTYLNLRGDKRARAGFLKKASRVLRYYWKLFLYAATAKPKIFHILWNNEFEAFDRTLLLLYYKLLGKSIVLTAHNVNAGRRDSRNTLLNRITLRIQYRLADHVFVHTDKMKRELREEFKVPPSRVTVIPYGINNAVPDTSISSRESKQRMGFDDNKRTILFFGKIRPYKGIEYLVDAFQNFLGPCDNYRLVIAGTLDKESEKYWSSIEEVIGEDVQAGRIALRLGFIPDDQIELYFKAADILVLPYREIFQSGILFLGYSFGLPVLAADVGSLKDEIVEGETGFVFRSEDPADLARSIERYFGSPLFLNLNDRRPEIRDYAAKRHSWDVVGRLTVGVYAARACVPRNAGDPEEFNAGG